jgi:ferrous iron transport protein A
MQTVGVSRLRTLSELEVGESGILVSLDLPPGVQNHLMYMGFVPDARVRALHRAPAGDPTVYSVDGIEIALRRDVARSIRVAAGSVINEIAASHASENSASPAPAQVAPQTQAANEPVEELTEALR